MIVSSSLSASFWRAMSEFSKNQEMVKENVLISLESDCYLNFEHFRAGEEYPQELNYS